MAGFVTASWRRWLAELSSLRYIIFKPLQKIALAGHSSASYIHGCKEATLKAELAALLGSDPSSHTYSSSVSPTPALSDTIAGKAPSSSQVIAEVVPVDGSGIVKTENFVDNLGVKSIFLLLETGLEAVGPYHGHAGDIMLDVRNYSLGYVRVHAQGSIDSGKIVLTGKVRTSVNCIGAVGMLPSGAVATRSSTGAKLFLMMIPDVVRRRRRVCCASRCD